jgi:hypothetical protein
MSDNRFDNLRMSLIDLSNDRLLELRMLPGTDLDDYLVMSLSYDILVERGYSEAFLMGMVSKDV